MITFFLQLSKIVSALDTLTTCLSSHVHSPMRWQVERNLCVVMISCLPWNHIQTIVGLNPPITMTFPRYDENTLIDIIAKEYPGTEENSELYRSFAKIVVDVFQKASRDVFELKYLIMSLFDIYIDPVNAGKGEAHSSAQGSIKTKSLH